jgi:hypothetical protein
MTKPEDTKPILKGTPVNKSEELLNHWCSKAFLRPWTYPGVYKGKNLELCDVLVVFEQHIILFSDKSCAYGDSGDPELD